MLIWWSFFAVLIHGVEAALQTLMADLKSSICTVDVVDATQYSGEDFLKNYLIPGRPAMIQGLIDQWPAHENWQLDKLAKTLGDVTLDIDSTADRMTLAAYLKDPTQREARYLFDSEVFQKKPSLRQDFTVPAWFTPDILLSLPPEERLHYLWLLIGFQGSGSGWHLDPHNTSAWNALLSGQKAWHIYPLSHASPPLLRVGDSSLGELMRWLEEDLPTLSLDHRPLVCIQQPGDVMFVPGGWWHSVVNLAPTVAVTANFAHPKSVRRILLQLSKERSPLYIALLQLVRADWPSSLYWTDRFWLDHPAEWIGGSLPAVVLITSLALGCPVLATLIAQREVLKAD